MPRRPRNALTNAVKAAIKASTHLDPEDGAAVALALTLAQAIDSAAAEDDPAAFRKQAGWLGPHLASVLRSLALTPETRPNRERYKQHEPDALDRLRAARRLQLHPDEQARVDADSSRLTEMRQRAIGWAKDGDTMQ